MFYVSCIACHISPITRKSGKKTRTTKKNKKKRQKKGSKENYANRRHWIPQHVRIVESIQIYLKKKSVMCQVSQVTCHMSHVACHLLPVKCPKRHQPQSMLMLLLILTYTYQQWVAKTNKSTFSACRFSTISEPKLQILEKVSIHYFSIWIFL